MLNSSISSSCTTTHISCPSLCAIILFMDHPCDLYLYGCSRRSPAPLANPLCPCPSIPPNCPQQVRVCFVWFAVVGLWEVRELPPVWQIHSSLARHLSICSFSSPTLLTCCCLMCHSIFSIQPIPSCIQTFIIRIDDLTNVGEIRAARRQNQPLRGPTISKSRACSGTSPP